MNEFDDIINMKRPVSRKHPPMSRISRAAQFGAFRALTGLEESISEEARITDIFPEINYARIERVNLLLNEAKDIIQDKPAVLVTYFVPDNKKSGGKYVNFKGNLRKIDDTQQILTFTCGTEINFSTILDFQLLSTNIHNKKQNLPTK